MQITVEEAALILVLLEKEKTFTEQMRKLRERLFKAFPELKGYFRGT
jgi:hypothetical protein